MKRPQEKQPKGDGFGLIGLLIVVAVIGLLAGGGLYFREGQERKSQIQMGLEAERRAEELRDKILRQQKQQLEETGEKPETQQPSSPDTTSWKTYRNEKYGFEVEYPQSWEVKEEVFSGDVVFISFSPTRHDFLVGISITKESLDAKIVREKNSKDFVRQENVRISSINAVRLIYVGDYYSYVLAHGEYGYAFRGGGNYTNVFEEMMKSFKFAR